MPCPRSILRRAVVAFALGTALTVELASNAAAQSEFPFGREFLLDARPMKGSKSVPMLDIAADGLADIELWCDSVKGQLVVAGNTITILTGERIKSTRACTPERVSGDEDVLKALNEVTNWRLEGDVLVLVGSREMRFRAQTN